MSKTAEVGAAVRTSSARDWVTRTVGVLTAVVAAASTLLVAAPARAELESVSAGVGAAVPLATPYLVYGRYPTFNADAILHADSLPPTLRLVGTGEMSIATINNTTTQQIRLWSYSLYAGARYETPLPAGETGLRPYAQLQIGGVYAVMGFNGVSAGVQNTGIELAGRFTTGFEAWVTPKFGVDFGFPLEYLAVHDGLFIWDAVFSMRVRLGQ